MVATRTLVLACLLAFPALPSVAGPHASSIEAHDGFRKHWWERLAPAMPAPDEQLEYADELREAGRLRRASREYRALVYNWPKSAEAPAAQFYYADSLQKRGLYKDAFRAYQFLVDVYAGFVPYEEVISRQLAIAKKEADRERRFLFFRYTSPEDAIPLFEKLILSCPQCKGVGDLQYRIGSIYEDAGDYYLAIDAYQKYLHMYPAGSMVEQAAFGAAECFYRLARRSPSDRELRSHAQAALDLFLARYPKSDMADQALLFIQELRTEQATAYYREALSYERSARHTRDSQQVRVLLNAAKTVYARLVAEYPGSKWALMARTRLAHINQRLEKYDDTDGQK